MIVLAAAPTAATAGDMAVQAAKTVVIVTLLAVGLRLLGKRQMAQLNVYDVAMLMAAANAVQNAMTAGRGSLGIGISSATAAVATGWLATRVLGLRPRLSHRLLGTPTVLVRDGTVLTSRLRSERVTPEELDEAIRQHGLSSVDEVGLAVFEVDGTINIVANQEMPGP